jgi:hypothetical protein
MALLWKGARLGGVALGVVAVVFEFGVVRESKALFCELGVFLSKPTVMGELPYLASVKSHLYS